MILVEAKFYPYLLMAFQGTGHTEAEYRAMFTATEAVGRRALAEKTKYVCISVSGGNMSAAERKLVAALMEESPKELEAASLRSFVIAESAVFRGVLTALRWISPRFATVTPVASIDVAMTGAEADLRENDIRFDPGSTPRVRQWLEQQIALQRRTPSVSPP